MPLSAKVAVDLQSFLRRQVKLLGFKKWFLWLSVIFCWINLVIMLAIEVCVSLELIGISGRELEVSAKVKNKWLTKLLVYECGKCKGWENMI